MKLRNILFITLLFISFSLQSQDIKYARYLIDTLCSPSMHGRGYTYNSDLVAAKFIRSELKKNVIQPYNNTFFQKFDISVNLFPKNMSVIINKKELIPGVDYLVTSNSPQMEGTYKICVLDKKILGNKKKYRKFRQKDHSEEFILIDTVGLNQPKFKETYQKIVKKNTLKAKGIIRIYENKLTYVPSQIQNNFPVIELLRANMPKKLKEITVNIDAEYHEKYQTQNIIGYIEGASDSCIVFSAHYDHIGRMGKDTYFAGANDNASGVTMCLDIAREISQRKCKPRYTMVFMFFSGEELGILGSHYYVENPIFPLSKIKLLINLDMVGTGDEGITLVNGKIYPEEIKKLEQINEKHDYLTSIKTRKPAANSDHFFFHTVGVKCFFIYTRGKYKEYHNVNDNSENIPLNDYEDLVRLLLEYVGMCE